MDDPLTPEQAQSALAAELVLGLLDGAERAGALRLQLADPAFADAVKAWEARLAPLHGEWAEVVPHDAVWDAVAARIGDPAADRRALQRWRGGAMLSGALAAGLAAILVLRPDAPPPAPAAVAVAQMVGAADGPVLLARYDPAAGQLRLRVAGMTDGPLAPELWVIPVGGAPVSLGGVPRSGQAAMGMSAAQRAMLVEGATLAVTMEPTVGMPHAAPSSAPVAAGKISII
ncbi:MAG: anti-sigma factor [bacterium]|nr:anti-sigma factor [bacterium]